VAASKALRLSLRPTAEFPSNVDVTFELFMDTYYDKQNSQTEIFPTRSGTMRQVKEHSMGSIAVVPRFKPSSPNLVAPRWHTVLFVALLLALTIGGALFQREARSRPERLSQHPNVAPLYVFLIAMEWGLFFYVWRGGLHRTGTKLGDLIGGRWRSAKDVAIDAASHSDYGAYG
jgi:hypothetical protein